MKSRTVISAVAGAMILLTGCNQDLKTSHSDVDDPSGQNDSEKSERPKTGQLAGLYVGVPRDAVREALGVPENFRQDASWQVGDYRYLRGVRVTRDPNYGDNTPTMVRSSGNLLADFLIIFATSAVKSAIAHSSEEIVETAIAVFDDEGRAVYFGPEMPDAAVLQRALGGDHHAQFLLQINAVGPFRWGWLCKAANAGNANARAEIGRIYQSGYPTRFGHAKAWYVAAADAGHRSAVLYAREVTYITEEVDDYEGKGEVVNAVCDPGKPPTKSLSGEAINLTENDCESVLRYRLEESHGILDEAVKGAPHVFPRLGTAYDRKVDVVKECLPGLSIYGAHDISNQPDYDSGDSTSPQDRVVVDYVVALRTAAVRWGIVSKRLGAVVPDALDSERRALLDTSNLEKAEKQASDWIERFGARVKDKTVGETSLVTGAR